MKKKQLLKQIAIALIFLSSCLISAQGYLKHHEITVPTPNTAELGKYGFTEIGKYTGIPNIAIPVYEMDFDGLKIPITLSYHAGGIKVSQESSWVGLGWSITANAMITRSVNQVSDIGSRKREYSEQLGDYGYCFEQKLPTTFNGEFESYLESYYGRLNIDTQPDIFVANLFGKTVKFILTQKASDPNPVVANRKIKGKLIDGGNAKIDYDDYNKNFTITDDNGFIYFFDKKEYSTNVYNLKTDRFFYDEYCDGCVDFSLERDMHIISGWYIRSVTSPNGKVLDFNYYLDNQEDSSFISISQAVHNESRTDTQCHQEPNNGASTHEAVNKPSQTVQESAYLKDIVDQSTGNKIVFKLSDRKDLIDSETWNGSSSCKLPGYVYQCLTTRVETPKKLSEVQIINSQGNIVKNIDFKYSYFNSHKISDERKESYLRLKLDGIQIDNKNYSFAYNQPNSLPNKVSKDVDFYGFYNGANNTGIYPSVTINDRCYDNSVFNYVNNDNKRGSNFTYGQIGLLNKVIYPTKGSTEYFYEGNTALINISQMPVTSSLLDQNSLESGYPITINNSSKTYRIGGARVSRIVNKDYNGQVTKSRRYTYQDGTLMNRLLYYTIGDGLDYRGAKYTNVIINSRNALGTENAAQGNHVGYSKVEEIITDKDDTNNIGKVVTQFINKPNEAANNGGYLIINSPPYHFEAENGDIISEKVFDANNTLKQEVDYQYSYKRTPITNAFKIFYLNLTTTFGDCEEEQCQAVFYNQVKTYYAYNIYETINLNTTKTEKSYEKGKLISKNSAYTYNEKNLMATMELSSSEFNINYKTENYYPFDTEYGISDLSNIPDLLYANRINEVIYTREYKNNVLTKHTLFEHDNFGNLILPSAIKENKKDIALAQIDTRLTFSEYDTKGNLLELSRPNSAKFCYIWGYNDQYPIAKIQNVPYNLILPYINNLKNKSNADNDRTTGYAGKEGALRQALDQLRIDFKEAMVSTYTYDPLIGVTSMTDPRGYTMYYEYDDFNRLEFVKDADGNLVSENKYNYKN